jgi:choline dehydrogenase-like flavoprotein
MEQANTDAYDAIVVGSGITGGWAAKELTERGLKVLMLERGRMVRHRTDYVTEHLPSYQFKYRMLGNQREYAKDYSVQQSSWFFNEGTQQFFVNDRLNPYTTAPGKPFTWVRGHQLGGRSLTWGRQSYRMAPLNFEENVLDGHGIDWPIRYSDLAPWYEHVERFIGVSGSPINHPMSPDGVYQKPYPMNWAERDLQQRFAKLYKDRPVTMARCANLTEPLADRAPCHYCGICERGCSAGAYFSTQASTLPAAMATGRLTVRTDSIVKKVLVDPATGKATGVQVLDANSRSESTYSARMIFLCASALETVRLLFLSATDQHPSGLANSSGALGRYVMDHVVSDLGAVDLEGPQMPQHLTGYRPVPLHIPRFRNVTEKRTDYVRGYQINAGAYLPDWQRGASMEGIGKDFKNALRKTGKWSLILIAQCECLPSAKNRVTLDPQVRDHWDMPVLRMDVAFGENEMAMRKEAGDTCVAMLKEAGYDGVKRIATTPIPGATIHEMGGAPMGRDRKTSILDQHNRCHDVPNLYVTDGSAMCSSSSANPSLTYMALTARAAAFAAERFKRGQI